MGTKGLAMENAPTAEGKTTSVAHDHKTLDVVTGAFSYSGAAIARQLQAVGHQVRTITGHPDRRPGGSAIEVRPLDFSDPTGLVESMRGATTLYNTYWVRFPHGQVDFGAGVANSCSLFLAARQAGVERVVHVSITHPSVTSPYPYFRGKAEVERVLGQVGVSYAVLRPAILFGGDGVLLNNIAWLLRRLPVFAIGGAGDYRVRAIHVDDLARLAVKMGAERTNQVIDAVRSYGAPQRCIFVFAAADDPPGVQWLAPYAACTMAEYFSERGGDALLIIDDLSKHAVIYRQLSLLLRNPPAREAYPGDIFYIHSRLLERAAKLSRERGGGSLTALPIAETQEGNLSDYISTNLISISDGQIVLDARLFHEGQKPAVNVGRSVSRVGGKTQSEAMRQLAEKLKLKYAQFLELEIFTRFGGMVDERTRSIVDHGRRIRTILTQPQCEPLSLAHQVALLLAIEEKLIDRLPADRMTELQTRIGEWLATQGREENSQINATGDLDSRGRAALVAAITELIGQTV